MYRMSRTAARVARIRHKNLLSVQHFMEHRRVRMLVMDWIEGLDLSRLLVPSLLSRIRERVSTKRWDYINRVIVTSGPAQSRIIPGVALGIIRDYLAGLAVLHREGLVHGDIKPSNLMIDVSGTGKIIDIGAAFEFDRPPPARLCTPHYRRA